MTIQSIGQEYDRTSYILVVDDDNTLLKFFKIHLNKFFSKVLVVKNAKEALKVLKEKNIDLVLSDIRMPRVDGLQLLDRVQKHDASIPVLLISGALLSDEQIKIAAEKADGYLRKPFSVDDLHEFLSRGMNLRQNFKRLSELLSDDTNVREILTVDPSTMVASIKQTKDCDPNSMDSYGEVIKEAQTLVNAIATLRRESKTALNS